MSNKDAAQNDAMNKVVAGLKTKSAKIRALAKAGYARADIARFLGIRYQHVRNVVLAVQEQPARFEHAPEERLREWVKIAPDGRVVLPVEFRRRLGVENGGDVQCAWEGGRLYIRSKEQVIRDVQAMVAPYLKGTRSLVDELIAERRAEAAKE
jgi:bifunctional DNA-binding transcriptional regulator/antitoxin component of YhaV-PrlF toxin-antitoxin module